MTHLSDTARVVLAAAAQRDDLSVLPFPDTVKAKGGAVQKVLTSLRNKALIQVIETDGGPERIVITREGLAAIGIEPEDVGEAPDTAPEAAQPVAADAPGDSAADPGVPDVAADEATTAPKPAVRPGTKQALLIDLLRRPEGATVDQIAERTGWQHHSIRGAISGALKKKLGLTVEATRVRNVGPNQAGAKGSTTVYRIVR